MTCDLNRAWFVSLALTAVLAGTPAGAEGVRIDNKVFLDDQKEPISRSSTLFSQDMVCDFLEKPAEIFVFDRLRAQLVLLNTDRRVSTRIALQDVVAFTEQLRARAAAQTDPFVQFLANPRFEQHYDPASGSLSLLSPWLSYEVRGVPAPNPALADRFREFSDCYVQLSPVLEPSARPPYARMMLNEALQRTGLLPQKVTLTMSPKRGILAKRITIRSEHELIDRLGEADRDRIVQAQQFMAIFNPVSLDQYKSPQ